MNKFIVLFIFLSGISVFATAQKKKDAAPVVIPDMPINPDTKLITYSDVVEIEKAPQKLLYSRALSWANKYYVNPKDVIREANEAEGKIVIKARYRIYTSESKEGTKGFAGDVMYTMTIDFKEEKYRYQITNFTWQKRSAFPIERWMDDKADTFVSDYALYLEQTDAQIKELIASFTTRMATEEKVKKDDW